MTKNVWELEADDVAIIDGAKYAVEKDVYKRLPRIGRTLVRSLVSLDGTGKRKKFTRNFMVEIE